MILGVTGTRHPIAPRQASRLVDRIQDPGVTEVHHGDCVGWDALAHHLALEHGKLIVVHPPDNDRWRAFCAEQYRSRFGRVVVLPPRPFLLRNQDLVDAVDELVAGPTQPHEVMRSGTWATVRYARRAGLDEVSGRLEVVYP